MKKNTQLLMILLVLSSYLNAQTQLTTLLDREANYQRLSGTVLVTVNHEIQVHQSYGYADYSQNVKNTNNTPFDIGSVSKQFTAAAILHLVHQNKIKLDDKINQYLGSDGSKKWKKVTVHQLLSHSSGIPSLFQSGEGTDDLFPTTAPISSSTLLQSVNIKKLKFKPGSLYSYSNTGYLILAVIIEHLSGKSYGDFMQEVLFDKYGLSSTSFGARGVNYAIPQHNYHTELMKEATPFDISWMLGAGGIYSTASDLNKWLIIIHSDSFLTREIRDLYFAKHVKNRGGFYAYGWDIKTKNEREIMEHDGTNMGYISYCGYDAEKGNTVIITTNQSYPSIETVGKSAEYIKDLANKIWRTMNGDTVEMLLEMNQKQVSSSTFEFEDGYRLNILKDKEDNLIVSGTGRYTPSRMIFEHPVTTKDTLSIRVLRIADQFETRKFREVADICDNKMRKLAKTGVLKLGFSLITKDLGTIKKITPYYSGDFKGKVRLEGENGAMDIDLYFNSNNDLMGIFEGGHTSKESSNSYITYTTVGGKLYMDGFPYDEKSALLTITDDELVFEQLGRQFVGKRINN